MTGIPNDEAVQRQTDPDEPTRISILFGRKGVTVTAWVGRPRLTSKVFPFMNLAELLVEVERLAKTCGMKRRSFLYRLWMGKPRPAVTPPPQNRREPDDWVSGDNDRDLPRQ